MEKSKKSVAASKTNSSLVKIASWDVGDKGREDEVIHLGWFIRKCLAGATLAFLCFLVVSYYYSAERPKSEKSAVSDTHWGKCRLPQKISMNCQLLFQGKRHVKPLVSSQNAIAECKLRELVKDCARLRFEHGYYDKPVSDEERAFPIAFGIKMHTGPRQVEQLLRTIYRPHNFYCIHIDSKTSEAIYRIIKSVADCLENVEVLPNRMNAVYASIRMVMIEFDCMKAAIKSGVKWKYYINLTGQEFVLRSNRELIEILTIFNGTNDIESYPLTIMRRVRVKFPMFNNIMASEGDHLPFKYKLRLYKGSAYGMFAREFVNFLLTDDVALDFYHWLNETLSPEETIWSTLNRLPFAPGGCPQTDIKHDNRHHASKAIIWGFDRVKCHGKFVRAVCVFSSGDLLWLRSSMEIAANKFHEDYDTVALDCLEEWVNEKAYSASLDQLDWYYYRNLPHVKYNRKLSEVQKSKTYLDKIKKIWLQNIPRNEDKEEE